MNEEEQLQKEWREIVIRKLDAVDREIKNLQVEVRDAMAISKDVTSLKDWVQSLDKTVASQASEVSTLKEKVQSLDKTVSSHALDSSRLKSEILEEVKKSYTSKEQFDPIKKLMWGAVGMILSAFLLALLGLVMIKTGSISVGGP